MSSFIDRLYIVTSRVILKLRVCWKNKYLFIYLFIYLLIIDADPQYCWWFYTLPSYLHAMDFFDQWTIIRNSRFWMWINSYYHCCMLWTYPPPCWLFVLVPIKLISEAINPPPPSEINHLNLHSFLSFCFLFLYYYLLLAGDRGPVKAKSNICIYMIYQYLKNINDNVNILGGFFGYSKLSKFTICMPEEITL